MELPRSETYNYETLNTKDRYNLKEFADVLLDLSPRALQQIDVYVGVAPEEVLDRLLSIKAGNVLAGEDELMQTLGDGVSWPRVEIDKRDAELVGVRVRVRRESGRDTDMSGWYREIGIVFDYSDAKAGAFSESVILAVDEYGETVDIYSEARAEAYDIEYGAEAEELHRLEMVSGKDATAFASLVAEIVGDDPESLLRGTIRRRYPSSDLAKTGRSRSRLKR